MATSFFYIYVIATSFFYVYVIATSFFYIYVEIYVDIYIDIYISFTNWRSVQSFYWTPFFNPHLSRGPNSPKVQSVDTLFSVATGLIQVVT